MKKYTTYLLWSMIILSAVLVGVWEFVPLKDASDRMNSVPLNGIGFQSIDYDPAPIELSVFSGCNLLKRYISIRGGQFFMTAVDGTGNRNAVHDPTLCFTGDGWTVNTRDPIAIPGGTGEVVRMSKGEEEKEVLVIFSDGTTRFHSLISYWMRTTLRRLTLGYSGEEPIRIIVQPMDRKTNIDWDNLLMSYPPLLSL